MTANADHDEALRVVRLAYEAMNYLGDILNGHDMVEPEDEAKTSPAFEAVRAFLAGNQPTPSAGVSEAMVEAAAFAIAAVRAEQTCGCKYSYWRKRKDDCLAIARAALAAAAAAGGGSDG